MNRFDGRKSGKPLKKMAFWGGMLLSFALIFNHCGGDHSAGRIVQEPLPYAKNALEPHISAATMDFHYGKHHAAYVTMANKLIGDGPMRGKAAEEIIGLTAGKEADAAVFNNVAQAWNHAFFWKCLTPGGGGLPTGKLAEMITVSFGGFDAFRKVFLEAAKSRFGSGWVWLVLDGDRLKVVTTGNADTPLGTGGKPLLCVDVWEHAYYLDYQNRRSEFVEKVIDYLVDWPFVAARLDRYTAVTP